MSAKNKQKKEKKESWHQSLKEETKHSIFAILSFVIGLMFTLASFGQAGVAGNYFYKIFEKLFGAGFFLVPIVFFIATISLISSLKPKFLSHTIIGGILFLISGLGMSEVMFGEMTGGYIGYIVAFPFLKLFAFWITFMLFTALFIISFLIMFNTAINIKLAKKEEMKIVMPPVEENKTIESPAEETKPILTAIKEKVLPAKKMEQRKIAPTNFVPPPLDLLERDKGKPSSGDIKANANIIKRTLQNFGIDVEMDEINIGPSITQYTFKPAEGVKLSRIVALQNDLSLALAAYPLRIEAPIPGKSLVGIEIPNSTKTIIGLGSLLADDAFQKSSEPLLITLGKDVTGKPIFSDLAKMPHLLVAGATGAGKSIFIHAMTISLLYHNSPESLRFIMIDPKRVELTVYNKIPHLLTPVITNAKKAILTLKWACQEMERRYEELLRAGVRDVEAYHSKYGHYNSMPYLIIIIDELADIMATYPREMEASVVRLAQMSRAIGIHIIVSTQRPSVEVITGLIKANITSRVALQVASQIDSRTILDMSGAEKLLGNGDMLFLAGDTAKPKRIQGSFVSEREVKQVVKYLAEHYKDVDKEDLSEISGEPIMENWGGENKTQAPLAINLDEMNLEEATDAEDEELYKEAKKLVMQTKKASTSYLQRKFKLGYARAARIMDMLEDRGVVGPAEGAKARPVLMRNEYEQSDANNF